MKIYLATPCYGGLCTTTYIRGLMDFVSLNAARGTANMIHLHDGESLIPRARDHILASFYKTDCTHLALVDADMGWRAQDLIDMVESGLPVVCGAYPRKGYVWDRLVREIREGRVTDGDHARRRATETTFNLRKEDRSNGVPRLKAPDGKTFIRLAAGATGFMVIERAVIDRMIAAYPERRCYDGPIELINLFAAGPDPLSADDPHRQYLGEDYGFCRLWTAIGGEIWLYLGAQLTHTGTAVYEGDVAQIFEG